MLIMLLGLLPAIISEHGFSALASSTAVLHEKTVLLAGDSITYGYRDTASAPRSWALRLQNDYGMVVTNKGQNGYSLSDVRDYTAYGNVDKRLHVKCFDKASYDYVILQGGINDIIGAENGYGHPNPGVPVGVGSIAPTKDPDDFDTATFAGGLERYFYEATTRYPNARIGYIVTYQTPNAEAQWGVTAQEAAPYWQIAREICAKWDIPYLDLFDDKYSLRILKTNTNECLDDALHLNAEGYELISPIIALWMATLEPYGSNNVSPLTSGTVSSSPVAQSTRVSKTSLSTALSTSISEATKTSTTVELSADDESVDVSTRSTGARSKKPSSKTRTTRTTNIKNRSRDTVTTNDKRSTKKTQSTITDSDRSITTRSSDKSTTNTNWQEPNHTWLIVTMVAASVVLLATVIIAVIRSRT